MITTLPRVTVDFELLMTGLLVYPGLNVKPAVSAGTFSTYPTLLFSGGNGRMISNGMPSAGWFHTLFLTLFTEDLASSGDVADTVYQTVHAMGDPYDGPGPVAGVGQVVNVEDVSMFSRVGAVVSLADKRIVQQSATFTVTVRPVTV